MGQILSGIGVGTSIVVYQGCKTHGENMTVTKLDNYYIVHN